MYVGQTRSRKLIADIAERGWGECTNRGELPPRRSPWFLDNGAFSDWKAQRAFDAAAFWFDFSSEVVDRTPPDFAVCPDRVAGGLESLAFSRRWFEHCAFARPGLPCYLAVQNGQTEADVDAALSGFAGIFVGGDLPWKIATGGAWVRFAHERGLPCHVGRVGTAKRVRWARRIGADSIDSCLPLWSAGNLRIFTEALGCRQLELL